MMSLYILAFGKSKTTFILAYFLLFYIDTYIDSDFWHFVLIYIMIYTIYTYIYIFYFRRVQTVT